MATGDCCFRNSVPLSIKIKATTKKHRTTAYTCKTAAERQTEVHSDYEKEQNNQKDTHNDYKGRQSNFRES